PSDRPWAARGRIARRQCRTDSSHALNTVRWRRGVSLTLVIATKGEFSMEQLLIIGGIGLLIFLVCRELTCWYFKLSAMLATLTEIRDLLKARQPLSQ